MNNRDFIKTKSEQSLYTLASLNKRVISIFHVTGDILQYVQSRMECSNMCFHAAWLATQSSAAPTVAGASASVGRCVCLSGSLFSQLCVLEQVTHLSE